MVHLSFPLKRKRFILSVVSKGMTREMDHYFFAHYPTTIVEKRKTKFEIF